MALLNITDLQSGYGGLPVLHGVNLHVNAGEVIALFGPNGAGKTTLAKTVFGNLPITGGDITYNGKLLADKSVETRAKMGLAFVPQESNTFPALTVEENLNVGLIGKSRSQIGMAMQHAYDMFPKLAERRYQVASTLSGGERQMLALASAVVTKPNLLVVDEPTGGLAPIIVEGLVERTLQIAKEGTTILWIIGDDSEKILPFADRGYLMQSGLMAGEWSETSELTNEMLAELYFGTSTEPVEAKRK